MCAVGDYYRFTEVADKIKKDKVTWLWSHSEIVFVVAAYNPQISVT